jgi:hypothetical protein
MSTSVCPQSSLHRSQPVDPDDIPESAKEPEQPAEEGEEGDGGSSPVKKKSGKKAGAANGEGGEAEEKPKKVSHPRSIGNEQLKVRSEPRRSRSRRLPMAVPLRT